MGDEYLVPKKYKICFILGTIILIITSALFYKSDSTLGRMLILTISFKMIKQSTILWGNGSGFFKDQYMTFQSEYFKNTINENYVLVADNVFHPMNEYVLLVIEHGIIFFIAAIFLFIFYLKKADLKTPEFLSLISILVFALFSYPFRYPIILLIIAYNLSSLSLKKKYLY